MHNLLDKAKSKKEELNKLKETDPAGAEKLKLRQSWRKAVAKAEGIKLKDNPDLIKKSITKENSKKKKSSEKWTERIDSMEEKMKKKQVKRKDNIQARKDKKKNTKIKRRLNTFKKKSTPGF